MPTFGTAAERRDRLRKFHGKYSKLEIRSSRERKQGKESEKERRIVDEEFRTKHKGFMLIMARQIIGLLIR